jgi:hypothetical protein
MSRLHGLASFPGALGTSLVIHCKPMARRIADQDKRYLAADVFNPRTRYRRAE